MNPVYTIGHSRHPADRFLNLLRSAGVDVLVDVRSMPASRFAPWANRRALPGRLASVNIDYLHLGQHLGGKPRDERLWTDGRPDWDKIRRAPGFESAIERVVALAESRRPALMCAEGDPNRCHRTWLVAPALVARGVRVVHLLPDSGRRVHPPGPESAGAIDQPQLDLWP
ncbi:MAG: DUF488 domain-containing protein [Proteobacteria bacterium]|nr:DUF488 domain-containing protein [Pseudomonadota bacterium]